MSVEDINRFTKDDVVCALEMFNEDYVTFPRDDIAKLSGLTMPVNKRNWRKQEDHLRRARAVQLVDPKTVRKWWDCPPSAVRFENGHITVRVSPSQELSDWLLDALHDGVQE